MADEIFQKRIFELQEFNMLLPGEPGYIDPATIYLGVDNVTWPEAKKMALIEFISNLHKEQGPYPLVDVNVNVIFDIAMTSTNYYLNITSLISRVVPGLGTTLDTVPFLDFNKRVDGFSLTLAEVNPGQIFDYLAFE